MNRFLEKLRNKPIREKRKIAMMASTSITAIIFIVYGSYSYVKVSESFSKNKLPDIASPVQAIKQSFSETFNKTGDEINKIKEILPQIQATTTATTTGE